MVNIICTDVLTRTMERKISIRGEGKVRVRPDTVRLNGAVQEVCQTYDEAVDRSVICVSPLRMRLMEAGFDSETLRSVSVSVRPRYEYEGGDRQRQVLVGFEYVHTLRMEIGCNPDTVNRILGALSGEGCPRFSLEYVLSDPSHAEADARRSAVADAVSKAEQISSAAGVRLGDIVSIRYGDNGGDTVMLCGRSMNGSGDTVPEDLEFTDEVLIEWELL